jgi:hypothetical protein
MFLHNVIFLVSWVGVRLSPLVPSATNWPIVPAPDDRWWVRSSRWNENWKGKPKYSEKTCPSATLSTTNPTWPDLRSNPGRRDTVGYKNNSCTHITLRLRKIWYHAMQLQDVHSLNGICDSQPKILRLRRRFWYSGQIMLQWDWNYQHSQWTCVVGWKSSCDPVSSWVTTVFHHPVSWNLGDCLTGPNILLTRVSGFDYLDFLHTHFTGLLEHASFNKHVHTWFQHDSATPHQQPPENCPGTWIVADVKLQFPVFTLTSLTSSWFILWG